MTLPKGYGSRGSSISSEEASQKGRGSGTGGKIIWAFIALCIVIIVIGVIVPSLKGTIENIDKMITQAQEENLRAEKQKLQDGIYWTVILISIGITAVGFFLCWRNYKKSNHRHPYTLQNEQKQHTFDNIFGFLAGLAITTGLITYYQNFLALIGSDLYNSAFQTNLTSAQQSSNSIFSDLLFVIPNLHLIDFFVIAIPLTHAGYLFLSTLANANVKENVKEVTNSKNGGGNKKINLHFRLVGAFIISIILIGLLFFLGGSIVETIQKIEPVINQNTGEPEVNEDTGDPVTRIIEDPNLTRFQSNGFVFWLSLIVVGMIAWSLTIRKLIQDLTEDENPLKRIRDEWIWLDVFTFGFLIYTALTIFYLQLIDSDVKLFYFNLVLSVVLVSRAVLNYYIGLNIYFPKPPPEEQPPGNPAVDKAAASAASAAFAVAAEEAAAKEADGTHSSDTLATGPKEKPKKESADLEIESTETQKTLSPVEKIVSSLDELEEDIDGMYGRVEEMRRRIIARSDEEIENLKRQIITLANEEAKQIVDSAKAEAEAESEEIGDIGRANLANIKKNIKASFDAAVDSIVKKVLGETYTK
jgi:F0F1-type ATP synthase membrane subunit b/b'